MKHFIRKETLDRLKAVDWKERAKGIVREQAKNLGLGQPGWATPGKIKINRITPPTVEAFYNGASLGSLNEYEFNDLRIQIKRERAEGYTLLFEGQVILINKHGDLSSWPKGLMDLIDRQLMELTDSW